MIAIARFWKVYFPCTEVSSFTIFLMHHHYSLYTLNNIGFCNIYFKLLFNFIFHILSKKIIFFFQFSDKISKYFFPLPQTFPPVTSRSLKIVISVCLFVSLIITQEPLDRFAYNFNLGIRKSAGMFLAWFKDSKLSESTILAKI